MISILVPTFNRVDTLRETLEDLGRQTRGDFEVIVGDDASADATPELLAGWPDPRVRTLRHPANVGIYANWNAMLAEARGEFVAIYHDHDVYRPGIVEASVSRLEADPSLVMVHTAVVMVDDRYRPVDVDVRDLPDAMGGDEFRRTLAGMMPSPVMAATTTVRREAYTAVGPYDDSRYGLGCDKDMWFRLATLGGVGYVREPQAFIRARVRGDGTAKFRWSSEAGIWRMRLDELAELGLPQEEARAEIAREYGRLTARAAFLGTPEERREGEALAAEFGVPIPPGTRALTALPPLRALARRVLLPRHHARLAAREVRLREAAETYLAAHPELAASLRALRPRA